MSILNHKFLSISCVSRAHLAEDDVLDADVEDDEEGEGELEDEDFVPGRAGDSKLLGFEVQEDLVRPGLRSRGSQRR